jgi:SAM-dependent methyltransferase
VSQPWWTTFFGGVAVDLWIAFGNEQQDRAEAEFIERACRLPPGGAVLDVPCGYGRHARALAARGHRVTGVDISTDFLKEARARQRAGEPAIRYEHREMRDLPWTGEFDGVICCGNSFGYLQHEENVEFLRAAARTLKPGGGFLIDTGVIAESALPNLQPRRWFEIGSIIMLIDNRYDAPTGRLETAYTFIRDGTVEKRNGSQQVYTLAELRRLLSNAGLGEFDAYSSPDLTPVAFGAQRLLLVSRRV